jgi:hypothetical protein
MLMNDYLSDMEELSEVYSLYDSISGDVEKLRVNDAVEIPEELLEFDKETLPQTVDPPIVTTQEHSNNELLDLEHTQDST